MKKIFMAVAVLAITALTAICFSSCNDENEESVKNNTNFKSVSNNVNPFDEVGAKHNQLLYDIAEHCDMSHLTLRDLYNHGINYSSIDSSQTTFDNYVEFGVSNQEFIMDYMEDSTAIEEFTTDKEFIHYYNAFRKILVNVCLNNNLISPDDFSRQILALENDIIKNKTFDNTDVNDIYGVLLASFSVARYSYAFWYDAYYNEKNPWHTIVINNINSNDLQKGLFNNVVKFVKRTVCAAAADVWGAVKALGNSIVLPPKVVVHNFITVDLVKLWKGIVNAGHASADAWVDN